MFPELTELLLIGCSIESIWTPRSKSTILTPKTNDNSGQCHSGSINTGTNHRVLPPVGGNEVIPGGVHNNSKKMHK